MVCGSYSVAVCFQMGLYGAARPTLKNSRGQFAARRKVPPLRASFTDGGTEYFLEKSVPGANFFYP